MGVPKAVKRRQALEAEQALKKPSRAPRVLALTPGKQVLLNAGVSFFVRKGKVNVCGHEFGANGRRSGRVCPPPWSPALPMVCVEVAEVALLPLEKVDLEDVLKATPGRPELIVHPEWPRIASQYGSDDAVIMVTGAKGVGKSTCVRDLVNRLLNKHDAVHYLETDIGQPELNTPGLIALHKVEEPMLLPSHCPPARPPVAAFFAGGVSPACHPEGYLAAVAKALEAFDGTGPLVVNTHGWATGMGKHLVDAIHMMAGVTVVVAIEAGKANEGKKRKREEESPFGPFESDAEVVTLQSVARSSSSQNLGPSASPAQLRWLRLACDLGGPRYESAQSFDGEAMPEFFRDATPVRLSRASLRYAFLHPFRAAGNGANPKEMLAHALPGTLVALCRSGSKHPAVLAQNGEEAVCAISDLDTEAECAGYGFVHSVTETDVVLYTNVEDLAEIDLLQRGEVDWTPMTDTRRPRTDGAPDITASHFHPFFCHNVLSGVASRSLATRKFVPRKSHRKA